MRQFVREFRAAAAAVSAVVALGGLGTALAAGTDAGTSVSNTFTLDYDVSGVAQTQVTNSGSPTLFTVDRKVDVTVTSQGDQNVTPGATGQRLVWGVLNSSNDNIAYRLSVADVAGDDFDASSIAAVYYTDAGGDGVFTPGVDDAGAGTSYTLGSGVTANVAPDATIWVVLTGTIPGAAANGDQDGVVLVADSYYPTASLDPAYAATPGTNITTAGANTLTGAAQDFLADGSGSSAEAANDGAHSDTAFFNVVSAALTASKAVAVVATVPVNCATDAVAGGFAAPGACVEYVISAANAVSASAAATNIAISDVLPDEVAFVSAAQSNFSTAGTLSTPAPSCTTSCTVSLTGATLNAGVTGTLTIRATVR
jgi:uncharacterized repeat protein (TIGR01451 family)